MLNTKLFHHWLKKRKLILAVMGSVFLRNKRIVFFDISSDELHDGSASLNWRRLAWSINRRANLTRTSDGLHVVVLFSLDSSLRITVAEHYGDFSAARVNADRMVRLLEGKLPVGDFFRVTASPASVNRDRVAARVSFRVRLWNYSKFIAQKNSREQMELTCHAISVNSLVTADWSLRRSFNDCGNQLGTDTDDNE